MAALVNDVKTSNHVNLNHSHVVEQSLQTQKSVRKSVPHPVLTTDLFVSRNNGYFHRHKRRQEYVVGDGPGLDAVERSNLVNLTKLIVKELIESSLQYGRNLESSHVSLQHLFLVLEQALRHGLRVRKSILGPIAPNVWTFLEAFQKVAPDTADIIESIKDLPTARTPLGRCRAWLRLVMMQKRLADVFRIMCESKEDIMWEFYEPDALLCTEDGAVLSGLLMSLNILDCNFCLKEEDLDGLQGVVDLALYLRDAPPDASSTENSVIEEDRMSVVLDQKHYVEEVNRNLMSQVKHLEQRLEHSEQRNIRLEEQLRKGGIVLNDASASTEQVVELLKEQLKQTQEERDRYFSCFEMEKQRGIETSMALNLLEKDVHEKQDTIISLRQQLDEMKRINIELYGKVQSTETSVKQKTEEVGVHEEKLTQLQNALRETESRLVVSELQRESHEEALRRLEVHAAERAHKLSLLESDVKIEREWRAALQASLDESANRVQSLQRELDSQAQMALDFERLRVSHTELERRLAEYELTLEEVGGKLSEQTLKVHALTETRENSIDSIQWADDKQVPDCKSCLRPFTLARRRHHCRQCGDIFCADCSKSKIPSSALISSPGAPPASGGGSSSKEVRVCDACFTLHLARWTSTDKSS